MITLESISLSYGSKCLYDEITATIGARDRIGLIGSNGSGKSTLLKILCGLAEINSGKISKSKYADLGYLPQDGIVVSGKTLYTEVESAFDHILDLQEKIQVANEELLQLDSNQEEYYELLNNIGGWEHKLEDLDAFNLKHRIEKVLVGLGFEMSDMARNTSEFSGGWQMRIALAKLLLREPALLLLDEPTNHLDLPSLRWIEKYLNAYDGAMLIISHDAAFLDSLCNKIFALSRGKLEVYPGNYSFYQKEYVRRREVEQKAYLNQQRQLEHTQKFIDRFRYKASKAKQVQSRIKALDKIERIEIESEEKEVHFRFPEAPSSGHTVMKLKKVSKSYGELQIFKDLDLRLEQRDRIAIVGPNGAGKSTLVKIISGIESFDSGERELGYNVRVSYFAQQQADELDLNKTPLEVLEDVGAKENETRLRTLLGAFLFRGDDVYKKVSVLSGGEKCRIALARMLLQKANLLILDEPTNHLDMKSKHMLLRALQDYPGTLILVSHDCSFLDPLVNKVLEITKQGPRLFWGNVSHYLSKIDEEERLQSKSEKLLQSNASKNQGSSASFSKGLLGLQAHRQNTESVQSKEQKREWSDLRKKASEIEKRIHDLESKKNHLEANMASPEFYKDEQNASQKMKEYERIQSELERLYKDWDAVAEVMQ